MQKSPRLLIPVLLISLLASVFLSACSDKPQDLLSKKKFSDILAEFIYIENLAVNNKQKQSLIKQTLETHQTTVEAFNKTKAFYKQDAQFWLTVYKQAQEKIKNRETALQKAAMLNSRHAQQPGQGQKKTPLQNK